MNIKLVYKVLAVMALSGSSVVFAQVSEGSTGMCKDGSYTTATSKKGACAGHKGVKDWYATAPTPPENEKATAGEKSAPKEKRVAKEKSEEKDGAKAKVSASDKAQIDGSTGMCKDGSYTTATSKKGACAGHKGVKDWYATAPVVAKDVPAETHSAPATTQPVTQAPAKKVAVEKSVSSSGGAGQVWVNTDSNVYHCQGKAHYGTTKQGEYMSEAAAKSSGARPDHGKPCSSN